MRLISHLGLCVERRSELVDCPIARSDATYEHPAARSRESNQIFRWPGDDQRSTEARRYRDIVKGLLKDMGVEASNLSDTAKTQVRISPAWVAVLESRDSTGWAAGQACPAGCSRTPPSATCPKHVRRKQLYALPAGGEDRRRAELRCRLCSAWSIITSLTSDGPLMFTVG